MENEYTYPESAVRARNAKFQAMKTALKNAADMIDHAIAIGHLGEGSTRGWAQDVLNEINGLGLGDEGERTQEDKTP